MFLLPIHVPWPNQASKKLTDQQTPQLNFPSLSLPSSVCSRLDFSTFVMDFTTPEASLSLRHFAHMEPTVSIFGSYVPWTSSRWERSHQSPLRKNGAMWEVVNSKGGRFFAGEPHCLTWEKMRLGMVWCSQLRFFGSFFFFSKKIPIIFWSFFEKASSMGFHGGWSWPATWWPLSMIFFSISLPETCLTVVFFPKIQTDISWLIEGLGCFGGFRLDPLYERDCYPCGTHRISNHQPKPPINHYPSSHNHGLFKNGSLQ